MARPGLTGHRKFGRLVRALSVTTTVGAAITARGALELLWEHAYETGEDYVGTSDDIEHAVGWQGERGTLTRALVEAGAPEGHGFIEPLTSTGDPDPTQGQAETRYRIHDLWHHAPDYVMKRRKRELERQQKSAPTLPIGPSAPNGGQCRPTPDWQNEVDRPPAPSPSPSPSPSLTPPASAEDVMNLWNTLVTPPIPKVTKLTADRARKIEARLKAYPDIETWRTVITWVNGQDWCRASGKGEHPNWTASLDWLCKGDGVLQRHLERAEMETAAGARRPLQGPRSPAARRAEELYPRVVRR